MPLLTFYDSVSTCSYLPELRVNIANKEQAPSSRLLTVVVNQHTLIYPSIST